MLKSFWGSGLPICLIFSPFVPLTPGASRAQWYLLANPLLLPSIEVSRAAPIALPFRLLLGKMRCHTSTTTKTLFNPEALSPAGSWWWSTPYSPRSLVRRRKNPQGKIRQFFFLVRFFSKIGVAVEVQCKYCKPKLYIAVSVSCDGHRWWAPTRYHFVSIRRNDANTHTNTQWALARWTQPEATGHLAVTSKWWLGLTHQINGRHRPNNTLWRGKTHTHA